MKLDLPQFNTTRPPEHLSDDDLVTEAKAALGILDFELFRAAWRNWYGAEPIDRMLEPAFVTYLFKRRLPGYARHFARQVLAEATAGRLEPADFGVESGAREGPVPDLRDNFAATSMACVLAITLVIVL
jgi:hypothetical protein